MTRWFEGKVKSICQNSIEAALEHQNTLTKPAGSLGRLEQLAGQFAGWQSQPHPTLNHLSVSVFAADHGVCAQGVSAFPQSVTGQMIVNFLEGGAAISVLSHGLGADLRVLNMGTVDPVPQRYQSHEQLENHQIAAGSADFSQGFAMSEQQLTQCFSAARDHVSGLGARDLFIGGEMGIGNTSSASALYAALLSLPAADVVGRGSGIDDAGLKRKIQVINTALALHKASLNDPYQVLRALGGLEIAALVASYIACAQRGIPVLVDGFICTAAALLAVKLNAGVRHWLLFSHQSAEAAHSRALAALEAQPLLDLGMRLGEGSGAAVAVPLIQSALSLHNRMASFAQAGVSQGA
ncbi:MAG: nicotinate-nucleotide--dimethylbenzimidazole phosphoribosyltransferase [Pseudomonadota bacterium]